MSKKNLSNDQNNSETEYTAIKKELAVLLKRELTDSKQNQSAQKVIDQIEKLKSARKLSLSDSIELLKDTKNLLNGTLSTDAYREKGKKIQGKPIIGLKILGALMIALGTLISAVCITLAAAIKIKFTGEGVLGAGLLAAGIGIFAGGVRGGLSKSMIELAQLSKQVSPAVY